MHVWWQYPAEPIARHGSPRIPRVSFLQIAGWILGVRNQSHWIPLRFCIRSDSIREGDLEMVFQVQCNHRIFYQLTNISGSLVVLHHI